MPLPYFYETDCFNLNREARLSNAAYHRLCGFLDRLFALEPRSGGNGHAKEDKAVVNGLLDRINSIAENIDWSMSLDKGSYVVFDTETTGLQPLKGDKVIELGCVVIENGCVQRDKTFVELVNPQRPIPPTASYITGITDGMVADKRTFPTVLLDFLDFVGNRVLVAHSATFDLAFLNKELGRIAPIRIINPVIDTYLLARCVLDDFCDFSLDGLARLFDVEIRARHTALGDSLITAELFLKMLALLKNNGIRSLYDLQSFFLMQKTACFGMPEHA